MTKKRLFIVAGVLAVLIGLGMGVAALIPEGPGVTKGNFDRIQDGMTMAEVEEMFGREGEGLPIGYISENEGEELFGGKTPGLVFPEKKDAILTWVAEDGVWARIRFLDDRVAGKYWTSNKETFFDKLRRLLHLD